MTEIKGPTDSTRVTRWLIHHKDMLNGKPVTTSNYRFPIQINQDVAFARNDMTITHGEADTLIIEQVDSAGVTNILSIAMY